MYTCNIDSSARILEVPIVWAVILLLGACSSTTGPAGPAGLPGPAGVNGADGAQGPVGPAGPAGATGSAGPQGAQGPAGPQGATGDPGANGTNGVDGHSSYITTSGLNLQIQSAAIANGVATVTFRITDGTGVPLDRTGLYTEGAVSMNWLIARLNLDADGSPGQYTNYITKVETNPADPTQTATQASSENNGTWTEIGSGAGTYQYTFKTAVNPPDPTLTHTIGVYASRVFQNETYVANATYDFRPDSEPVTVQRQEVTEATCNQCHNPLEMHGGVRRETALCILCHTPQSGDAETGNTVDFKVLIHKIHQGANLPSVKNGIPYEIVGYQQSVNNFSNIVWPQDTGHCQTCHQNDAPAGATSGSPTNSFEPDVWKTKPSSAACFSCHDNLVATPIAGSTKLNITVKWPTDFGFPSAGPCATDADCRTGFNVTATCNTTPGAMLGHCQLTQHPTGNVGDADCATCHAVGAAIAPIDLAHQDLKYDPNQDALRINIVAVNDTAPGDIPVMTFQVTDQKTGKPYDIIANPMVRLSTNVAGPTTDYAQEWSTRVQGSGASGTLAPDPSGMPGLFQYTFPSANAIPASATGTYAFGLEGYTMATDNATRLSIPNPVFYAAVTDATPMARQPVVDTNKCDSCHKTIGSNHGYMRNNTDYCVMCHNANLDDKDRLPMLQGQTLTVWSMHFTRLIHEIHRGSSLSTPFMVGGSRPTASNPAGSPADFSQVVFPGDLKDCETCHLPGTYNLPVPAGRLPSLSETFTCEDPNPQPGLLCPANNWNSTATYTPPETAVCTACHDTPDTAAHAEAMTSGLGESCSVCHAIGRDFGVDVVHASPP